jgi:hypothetical protein
VIIAASLLWSSFLELDQEDVVYVESDADYFRAIYANEKNIYFVPKIHRYNFRYERYNLERPF